MHALKERLAADKTELACLDAEVAGIKAAEQVASEVCARVAEAYAADQAAISQLQGVQTSTELCYNLDGVDVDADAAPTQRKWLDLAKEYVAGRVEASEACAAGVASRATADAERAATERESLRRQLQELLARRTAVDIGRRERAEFAAAKEAQVEGERAAAAATAARVHAMEACAEMLRVELERTSRLASQAQEQATHSDASRAEVAGKLDDLRAAAAVRRSEIQSQLASERDVSGRQGRYIATLRWQLDDSAAVAECDPYAPAQLALIRCGKAPTAPGGAAAALLAENDAENAAWLSNLKQQTEVVAEQRSTAVGALEAAEKHAALERQRLASQHQAQTGETVHSCWDGVVLPLHHVHVHAYVPASVLSTRSGHVDARGRLEMRALFVHAIDVRMRMRARQTCSPRSSRTATCSRCVHQRQPAPRRDGRATRRAPSSRHQVTRRAPPSPRRTRPRRRIRTNGAAISRTSLSSSRVPRPMPPSAR